MAEQPAVSVDTLKAIAAAFNAHDLDAIMEFFADDCTLEMPGGPSPGTALHGQGRRARRVGVALQGSSGRPLQ